VLSKQTFTVFFFTVQYCTIKISIKTYIVRIVQHCTYSPVLLPVLLWTKLQMSGCHGAGDWPELRLMTTVNRMFESAQLQYMDLLNFSRVGPPRIRLGTPVNLNGPSDTGIRGTRLAGRRQHRRMAIRSCHIRTLMLSSQDNLRINTRFFCYSRDIESDITMQEQGCHISRFRTLMLVAQDMVTHW
jgi:hypothetical protein